MNMMQSDLRATDRRPLRLMVKSRVKSRVVPVTLIDISEGGCKIKASPGFAEIGDRVTMKVGGVHAPIGYIAWIEGRIAGISFDGEIHQAVLDHLCAAHLPDFRVDKDTGRRV